MKQKEYLEFKEKLELLCKVLEDYKVAKFSVRDKYSTTHIFKFELYWQLSEEDYSANDHMLSIDHHIVDGSGSMIAVEEYDYNEMGELHRVYPSSRLISRFRRGCTSLQTLKSYGIFSKRCPLSAKTLLDKMSFIAVECI